MESSNTPSTSVAPSSSNSSQQVNPPSNIGAESTEQSIVQATQQNPSDSLEAAEQAIDNAQTVEEKKQAVKTLKKLKLKFNQKEYEEELPFEIPDTKEARDYMTKQLQLARLGHTKSQDYNKLEQEALEFIELLKSDPEAALTNDMIGVDVKKFAKKIIEREIEQAKKSPEQIEKEKMQAELKQEREDKKRLQEEFQQKELERLTELEFEKLNQKIDNAFIESKLPKNPYFIKKMGDYLSQALELGLDLEPSDVLPLVQEEAMKDFQQMIQAMPDEALPQLVGKDRLNNMRKQAVAKAKAVPTPVKKLTQDVGVTKEQKASEKKSFKDFFGGGF